jgi:hypothetical protein
LKQKQLRLFRDIKKIPEPGDVVYGMVTRLGQHSTIENVSGRIHMLHHHKKSVFVFGNRYAPDYYEGVVPHFFMRDVDMLARSGIVGLVRTKSSAVKDPTRIRILGYVCGEDGNILNTRQYPLICPKNTIKKMPRSKLILVCGTSMNSGKSLAAAACCRALASKGYTVRASKVTGTASLKDILHMNDAGAGIYADFSYFGYPSTYLLPEAELMNIFNHLDLKYANNPRNYWIVEFADGIIQRETSMLLHSKDVISRIHRLIFCANDAFGIIGGLKVLKERFNLIPDALSGVCSSSPLHVQELLDFTDIPVFNSASVDEKILIDILRSKKKGPSGRLMKAA